MKKTRTQHYWLFTLMIIFFAFFWFVLLNQFFLHSNPQKQIAKQHIIMKKAELFTLPKVCHKDPKVAIYMYHYVRPDSENISDSTPYKLSILPEEFAKQIHFLKNLETEQKISIIFFSELEKYEQMNCFPSDTIVLLTSDDGWDDTYRHILPVIEKEHVKFHTALISNRIGSDMKRIDTFMTKTEVKKVLASSYFEVLSHTYTHPELPKDTEE